MSEMSERFNCAKEVIKELREMKNKPPYQPTADVDLVWVVSQPGTVSKLSEDGVYKILAELGISNDLEVVKYGIRLVTEITALKLGIRDVNLVTSSNIDHNGPVFFYNGEDSRYNYPQNEDLMKMVSQPDFIIPPSRIEIHPINGIGTPAQVTGFAEFLKDHSEIKRVAVVSMASHSVRVGRYLEHYKDLFPTGIAFENACLAETNIAIGSTLREIKKVVKYLEFGHLARENFFRHPGTK